MSTLGYRKREDPHFDVTGDTPRLLKDIVAVHTADLSFDIEEMSQLLDLPQEVFKRVYLHNDTNLRLVN